MRPLRPCFVAAVLAAVVAVPVFGCSDGPATSPIAQAADPYERAGVDPLPAPPPTTAPPTTTTTTAPPPHHDHRRSATAHRAVHRHRPLQPTAPARRPAPAPAPAAPPPPAPPAPAPKTSDEARALQLVNSERAKAGRGAAAGQQRRAVGGTVMVGPHVAVGHGPQPRRRRRLSGGRGSRAGRPGPRTSAMGATSTSCMRCSCSRPGTAPTSWSRGTATSASGSCTQAARCG